MLLSKSLNAQHIEASSVVREVRGNIIRSEMHTTNNLTAKQPGWLGEAIASRIDNFKVVLTGTREREVHDTLQKLGPTVEIVTLIAPTQERYQRLLNNKKVSNYGQFNTDGQAELDIGLTGLLEANYPTFMTTHYTEVEVSNQILAFLKIKNSTLCT